MTVFAVGQAVERNPEAAHAMIDAGWEVASHGWRWIDYGETGVEEERAHMRRAIDAIERVCGVLPSAGTQVGGPRRPGGSSSRTAASSTTRIHMRTSCRTGREVDGHDHLVIPYTLDANDFKFLLVNGFVTAREFAEYLVDTLDQLRLEGGRMMSVGLHCRIVGRPGRAPALHRFLEHVATCDDVWVASRSDIARHWHATHPRAA